MPDHMTVLRRLRDSAIAAAKSSSVKIGSTIESFWSRSTPDCADFRSLDWKSTNRGLTRVAVRAREDADAQAFEPLPHPVDDGAEVDRDLTVAGGHRVAAVPGEHVDDLTVGAAVRPLPQRRELIGAERP